MKLTQNQISEFITELTATNQGIQELFRLCRNANDRNDLCASERYF